MIFLFSAPDLNLHHYINVIFYISFSYLVVWLLSYIIKGRFFDGVVYGFRRFGGRITNKDLLDEWADKPNPSDRISTSFLALILFQGLVLTLVMISLLFFYYM
ncbi:DUF3899 domain-containing protein [Aquibacillus halophilus]|nr:DUF3899 domain-containing protein [Aquibacillus halophilus]